MAPTLFSCENHCSTQLPSQPPTPASFICPFHTAWPTKFLSCHYLSRGPALDASFEACPVGPLPYHSPYPVQEPTTKPKCMSPHVPLTSASGPILPPALTPLAACPSLGWAQPACMKPGRVDSNLQREEFGSSGEAERPPPGETPPTCHSASPSAHLIHLHMLLWGGWDQAVPSVPRRAPGRGAWLWPAGHRQ